MAGSGGLLVDDDLLPLPDCCWSQVVTVRTTRRIRVGGWLCVASGILMLLLATLFLFGDVRDCREGCRGLRGSEDVCECSVDYFNVFLSFGSAMIILIEGIRLVYQCHRALHALTLRKVAALARPGDLPVKLPAFGLGFNHPRHPQRYPVNRWDGPRCACSDGSAMPNIVADIS
ncbi:unnamed protein product [Darwinula stevensoni]|uniref:Uncharacterized protein n=1 Tax=Darwinula stevensoni TaxID=69355 RepID=A0A7R9AEN9_9CRUS|nr:unnamed protein product [Darwinula stevensoni]CAG0902528.1 unnamed protein product [Darwinula stevensoni]